MQKRYPELVELIEGIVIAQREYDRLAFDEEFSHDRGAPASADQIVRLERILGHPLPPNYRAFLELHNGWSDFHGDGKLLAVEDHESSWVKKKIRYWSDLWSPDEENPFEHGAIPILLGDSLHHFLVLDPRRMRKNGNMDFVEYDYMHEETSYEDFALYLGHELNVMQRLIDRETKGILNDEEEDETD